MLKLNSNNTNHMISLGEKIGHCLVGGEIVELRGDVGAGKTTLAKGIAKGLKIDEDVQSPSFTISRVYDARDGLSLAHYDFYRLSDPGIMSDEMLETVNDTKMVTVIEWGDIVEDVLPIDRLTIEISTPSEDTRQLTISSGGNQSNKLLEKL
jgi:tRNA threonylcarbamoyladenosine biosynthesis protein TsaE